MYFVGKTNLVSLYLVSISCSYAITLLLRLITFSAITCDDLEVNLLQNISVGDWTFLRVEVCRSILSHLFISSSCVVLDGVVFCLPIARMVCFLEIIYELYK